MVYAVAQKITWNGETCLLRRFSNREEAENEAWNLNVSRGTEKVSYIVMEVEE